MKTSPADRRRLANVVKAQGIEPCAGDRGGAISRFAGESMKIVYGGCVAMPSTDRLDRRSARPPIVAGLLLRGHMGLWRRRTTAFLKLDGEAAAVFRNKGVELVELERRKQALALGDLALQIVIVTSEG